MRIISKRCLGLDLHKKQITAYLRVQDGADGEPSGTSARFGTMPADLERLRDWVVEHAVTDVVMESTSVYWMHVYELLEPITRVAVVNASHVKKVPGRKTDMSDAEWLADLHAHGLIRLSFIPPKPIRELRTLTRYRTKLVAIRTGARNRTIKMLEIAGIKLSSVVSDSFGVTGRALLDILAQRPDSKLGTDGSSPRVIAQSVIEDLARGALRKKAAELSAALAAPLSESGRDLLEMHLRTYDAIEAQIAEAEKKLLERSAPYAELIQTLDAIPGINPLAAITLLAETGVDMTVYRDAHHLTALAGLAPGNNVSDRRQRKGNHYLKRICVQIAWAVTRKKDSFLRARFGRLSRRIGRNKAIVATARQILRIVYLLLSTGQTYRDVGANYYDLRSKQRVIRDQVRRLEKLGFRVELTPLAP